MRKDMAVATQAQGRINENVNRAIESGKEQVNDKFEKIDEKHRTFEAAIQDQDRINYQNGKSFESIGENIDALDQRQTCYAWEMSNRMGGLEVQHSVLQEEVSRRQNQPGFFGTIGGLFDQLFGGPPPNPRRLQGRPQQRFIRM